MVAPCTTIIRDLASEVVLEPGDDPVGRVSAVSLDSLESVSLGSLVQRIGRLSEIRLKQIGDALAVAVACRR
jgi:mRNA interferase MazF